MLTEILTFTAGVVTAALPQAFGIGRDLWAVRIKRKSEASYLALQLAPILERYAHDCASFISDNADAQQGPHDEFPAWSLTLPELPPFPTEVWPSIDPKLAVRAVDLRNHLAGSQGVIDSTAEFAPHYLGDEISEHAALRGTEAWALAKDLRSRFRLPAFVPVWDFTETFENALQMAKKAEEKRARQAEWLGG